FPTDSTTTSQEAASSPPSQAVTTILPIPATGASPSDAGSTATNSPVQSGAATTIQISTTIMKTIQVTATGPSPISPISDQPATSPSAPQVVASAQPSDVTTVFVTE